MRYRTRSKRPLWHAFLRTTAGRRLLREGIVRRPSARKLKLPLLSPEEKMLLVLWVLLCLLALALGAWFGEASGRDRWIDDDARHFPVAGYTEREVQPPRLVAAQSSIAARMECVSFDLPSPVAPSARRSHVFRAQEAVAVNVATRRRGHRYLMASAAFRMVSSSRRLLERHGRPFLMDAPSSRRGIAAHYEASAPAAAY